MMVDYYAVLEVDRSSKVEEIRNAYQRLALKWHPDRNPNSQEAAVEYKKISEAYEVLSNPETRALFDGKAKEGLTVKEPTPCSGGPSSAVEMSSDPIGRGRGAVRTGIPSRKSDGDLFGAGFVSMVPSPRHLRKAPPIQKQLPCSLEELYNGTTKRMEIRRLNIDENEKAVRVKENLTIEIVPGWSKGIQIIFREQGNEMPDTTTGDIIFIIDEKPHDTFTREGNDLIITQKITLMNAITGYTVQLVTLDCRNLDIHIDSLIHPSYEEVVPQEGMPDPNDPRKKGNLRIRFDIVFPLRLNTKQKNLIKEALSSETEEGE